MNNLINNLFLLQTSNGAAAPARQPQSFMLLTFGAVLLIFYFLIIRPQNKRQKETKKMIDAVQKGDKVVSIGGIHGVVSSVKDTSIVVKVDDNAKIEFTKSAIASVIAKNNKEKA